LHITVFLLTLPLSPSKCRSRSSWTLT